jgi:general secretion pathway protein B
MSFILDALRKSEIERQRQSGPSIAEFPIARADRRLPVALIAIGFLLAINLAIVLFFLLRDSREPEAEAAPTQAAAPPAAAAAPPPRGAATAPPGQSPLQARAPALPPAEPAEPPAEYYGEMPTLPPDAPDPTLLPDTQAAAPGVTYGDALPDDAVSTAAATGLPELTVDLHIYTDDPAKRAVFINGRRYTQGAQIVEGPVVQEITREGAMLTYRGRRFLLPRL